MRRSSLLLPMTAPLACALALGCGDQPSPSEPGNSPPPSFRTAQNPDGPGAFVEIVPEAFFLAIDPDPAPGLTVIMGATFAEFLEFCATGEPPLPARRLLVFRPDGSVMTTVQGAQLPLLVWETVIDPLEGEQCEEAFLETPHLEGIGGFSSHDNDLFTTGNRANAAGLQIHGHVSSEDGERFLFSGKFHIVLLRNGEVRGGTFDLQLKPTGQ
jgi:hypothetical protein